MIASARLAAAVLVPPDSSTEPGDLAVIDAIAAGRREQFAIIVRRYNARLFRLGMAYLRSHAQAEDAMQNAYLKAFLNLARFRRDASFATWLTRIMINECLMLLRRRPAPGEPLADVLPFDPPDHAPVGAARLNLQEMKTLLEHTVSTLPRAYRAVYLLREVERLSTAETAAALRISPASVKVTLHRARERLKSDLLKSAAGAELFSYPAVYCERMTQRVFRAIAGRF